MRQHLARPAVAAALSTLMFGAAMVSQIVRRSALTMDEIHTALLGMSWAQGEVLPFYVGSVTRYEGGSWLIAWPVSWLLRAGAGPVASTSWAAGLIAITTVFCASLWLARTHRWLSGAAVGLVAACVPELVHYSYRAWGNLAEALVILPLGALALSAWIDRGRSLRTAPLLGLLAASGVVLSYFHMITALALVAVLLTEAWPHGALRRRAAAIELGVIAGSALAAFGLWVLVTYPFPFEAAHVRDGRSLLSLLPSLLFPRIDTIVLQLPGAWVGQLLDATPARLLAGGGLSVLTVGGAVAAWRSESRRLRWLVLFAVAYIPALSVGHLLLGVPDVYRYHLPFFAVAVLLIASWGWPASLGAVLCGLAFWLPNGLGMPYQNPTYNYLELGGNAMHRYHPDPHIKFKALRAHVPDWYRRWFAFGYGVDLGQRYSRARRGMGQVLAEEPYAQIVLDEDPHFSLYPVEAWVDWWAPSFGVSTDRREYLLGLGIGFASDAAIDLRERELLDHLARPLRDTVLEGVGAAIMLGLQAPRPPAFDDWDHGLAQAPAADYEAVGRGMARVLAAAWPAGRELGLSAGPRADALAAGQTAEVDRAWRAMVSVPMIPTPESLTDEERDE